MYAHNHDNNNSDNPQTLQSSLTSMTMPQPSPSLSPAPQVQSTKTAASNPPSVSALSPPSTSQILQPQSLQLADTTVKTPALQVAPPRIAVTTFKPVATQVKSKPMARKYTKCMREILAADPTPDVDQVLRLLREQMCSGGEPNDWPTEAKLKVRIKVIRREVVKSKQPRPGPWASGYIAFTANGNKVDNESC